jgi:hypothetical protein
MKTFEAQIDDIGRDQAGRESVQREVSAALVAAGIQAEIHLDLVNLTGQLTIESEAPSEDVLGVVRSCRGIAYAFEENPDDPHIQLMAVQCDPPSDNE